MISTDSKIYNMTNYQLKASGPELMTLTFFANRFGIKEEVLNWGIVKITPAEEAPVYIPAVLIKDTNTFIDIQKDSLCSTKSLFGRVFEQIPANIEESSEEYIFETSQEDFFLNKQELSRFYASKIFTPEAID